jgi:hypothetical protein
MLLYCSRSCDLCYADLLVHVLLSEHGHLNNLLRLEILIAISSLTWGSTGHLNHQEAGTGVELMQIGIIS